MNTVASCWIFFVNYTMMHGSTNIRFTSHKRQNFCVLIFYTSFVWNLPHS